MTGEGHSGDYSSYLTSYIDMKVYYTSPVKTYAVAIILWRNGKLLSESNSSSNSEDSGSSSSGSGGGASSGSGGGGGGNMIEKA